MLWPIIFHSSAVCVAPRERRQLFGGCLGLAGGLHHTEGQGVPTVLVADEKHHFLPVGALVDLLEAEALSLENRNPNPPVVLPRESLDGGGRVGGRNGEQLVNAHPEHLCHGGEEGHVGAGELALPLGYGLGGHPQPIGQKLLGQTRGAAEGSNIFTHMGKVVFHGTHAVVVLSEARLQRPAPTSPILYHRGRVFDKQPVVVFSVFPRCVGPYEVTYVINPKGNIHDRVMPYACGDSIHDCVVISCQSSDWIKKRTKRSLRSFLDIDYILDTPTEAVQKAVHTVTLNFLSLLTCRRAKALFLFQTKSFRHASSLWDAPMLFVIL